MRVLIAPDSFKGSLTARAAGEAIARGCREADSSILTEIIPLSDGGEGFAEVYRTAIGEGDFITVAVDGPNGEALSAHYVRSKDLAVIEIAQAIGLERIDREIHDPLSAHSGGVGQLIDHALGAGATRLIIGLGGSATTDGGAGMLVALGVRLLDEHGDTVSPHPRNLDRVETIDATALANFDIDVTVACDVTNPLLGKRGAAAIFGPQKGATATDVEQLDALVTHLSDATVVGLDEQPVSGDQMTAGAGAAGGLGWALMRFLGARLTGGFSLLAQAGDLAARIRQADLICTGEGKVDAQTLSGKAPAGVWDLCQRYGKPLVIFAGTVDETDIADLTNNALSVVQITPIEQSLGDALRHGESNLEAAARTFLSQWQRRQMGEGKAGIQ
ncbi:MAG: glycerate kinase [Actinomycetaceae bacterium]|nr:glycerate kinase [Actinomycetaceae bacterium]